MNGPVPAPAVDVTDRMRPAARSLTGGTGFKSALDASSAAGQEGVPAPPPVAQELPVTAPAPDADPAGGWTSPTGFHYSTPFEPTMESITEHFLEAARQYPGGPGAWSPTFSVVGNDPTTLVVCDVPPPGYDEHGQPLPGAAGPNPSTPVQVYRPFAQA